MKHIYFLLVLLITAAASAQSFELTPEGLISESNDYLVIEQKGTQAELYAKTLAFLTATFGKLDKDANAIENEMLTVSHRAKNAIRRNGGNLFDLKYTIVYKFKDGAIRMDAPRIRMTSYRISDFQDLLLVVDQTKQNNGPGVFGIYKNGDLKSENAKADLENYFNTIVKLHLEALSLNEDW